MRRVITKTPCFSRENCKNKDSYKCISCARNQYTKVDHFECDSKQLKFDVKL